MIITSTEKFEKSLYFLTENQLQHFIKIYDQIDNANSISDINSSPLVGFPYLHTIEFGKYVIGIQVKNNEVELAGIVKKGKELGLFF